jgi:serine/threonine protein phosphatase PrpC
MEFVSNTIHGAALEKVTLSLGKDQDFVFTHHHVASSDGEPTFDILAVFDGHGVKYEDDDERYFMYHLRNAPLDSLLSAADPVTALVDYLRQFEEKYDIMGGAVGSIVHIYPDRVVSFNVGDSKTLVFLDGLLVYSNQGHTGRNPLEKERLSKTHVGRTRNQHSHCPVVLNSTDITMIHSSYTIFYHPLASVNIAPTQSFGHHGVTGYDPDTGIVPYTPEQKVHVIVASDGLMDMVSMTHIDDVDFLSRAGAQEIGAFAEGRWNQSWNYVFQGKVVQTGHQFPRDSRDDVGVVTWTKMPNV